jgi:predicted regulator of Ras-like GTPase activity (Roadblock/LC7/MglB family)
VCYTSRPILDPGERVFSEQLKKIIDKSDGAVGALVMGLDGIAVDSYMAEGHRMDINTLGMEFSFILAQATKASELLKLGGVEEFVVRAESRLLVIRMLSPEYFLAVVLKNSANFGKCRYLMRVAQPGLSASL